MQTKLFVDNVCANGKTKMSFFKSKLEFWILGLRWPEFLCENFEPNTRKQLFRKDSSWLHCLTNMKNAILSF